MEPEEEEDLSAALAAAAHAGHEAVRAFWRFMGDRTLPSWDDISEWQRQACLHAAAFAWGLSQSSPNPPNMIPYAALPSEQRAIEVLFAETVRAVMAAYSKVKER